MTDSGLVERLWARVAAAPRVALEEELPPTDLQTLLLLIARRRAATVTTTRVLRRWSEDRFVIPSTVDPRLLAALESELWQRLPEAFAGVELSPVAPFGACAAVARVDQNRVLTTTRTSEVVADPTTVLALEAARRRRAGHPGPVHLAAAHRVLRTQRFSPPFAQHFRLFALVSTARDGGSWRSEANLLLTHLRFYTTSLSELFRADRIVLRLTSLSSALSKERLESMLLPALQPLPANVTVLDDPARTRGRGYYRDVAVAVHLKRGEEELEIGDGGFTDWTARLIPDAKERCFTSCIATERLAALTAESADTDPHSDA